MINYNAFFKYIIVLLLRKKIHCERALPYFYSTYESASHFPGVNLHIFLKTQKLTVHPKLCLKVFFINLFPHQKGK
jgi:hypothetical protein